MSCMIKTQNLSFEYEDSQGDMAVKELSLTIEKGSFVAVVGHNGSGKSTFAKLINGILQPCSGSVLVNGLDTRNEQDLMAIRRQVGMVFQNPDNQIVGSVVEEDVAFGPENLGVEPALIRQRVDRALEIVGMSDYRLHSPSHLSGGQKQRVAIAGILAMQPECIVLDEATAMLDPSGRQDIMDTIKHLNRTMGLTVVLITHYMNEAAQADRVIVMNDGRVCMDDVPQKVFARVGELEDIGLDVPQTSRLVYKLKEHPFFSQLPMGLTDPSQAAQYIAGLMKGGTGNE